MARMKGYFHLSGDHAVLPGALVKFHKRFNHKWIAQVNELILTIEFAEQETEHKMTAEKKIRQ